MALCRVRRRLSQRLSASSSTPAIMESAAEGEAKQEGDPLEGEEDLQGIPGQPGGSFHCDVCSIDTTSAAHLEVGQVWGLLGAVFGGIAGAGQAGARMAGCLHELRLLHRAWLLCGPAVC